MSGKTLYVFDTNTLISAILFEHSTPDRALRYALKQGLILLSFATFDEIAQVLQRKKFDIYISSAERDVFLEALLDRAVFMEPDVEIDVCRDTKDNKFLEVALSGKAQCIITGDNDLLILNPFRGIEIVSPEEFLRIMHEKTE